MDTNSNRSEDEAEPEQGNTEQNNGGYHKYIKLASHEGEVNSHPRRMTSTTTTTTSSGSSSEEGSDSGGEDHVIDNQFNRKRERAFADEYTPPAKKATPKYSDFSMKMMANMGYTPGLGLGRDSTGIVEPIEDYKHKGRRGLGYSLEGLEREDVKWELEEVNCNQSPVWLPSCTLDVLTQDDMEDWITVDEKKMTINDETLYCDEAVLRKILDSKSVFDELGSKEFLDARQRSNPYETIKGAIFQNRAAMKMANIDAVFDFMFTKGFQLGYYDVLYFADICAGPGGFSEYVFWCKKWHAKGFGFTLKDPESGFDFKLDSFHAGPSETFDPHYGQGGYNGDGDITKLENLQAFQEYVLEVTDGEGVHFVMADGGSSVEGQENIQEILMKQLVLCQYLCALSILRTGGHFVCKVFDMFTPFSVGLFYLLYRCFEQVCIFKPVTSRPANSERYVVCKSLRPETESVYKYMWIINAELCRLKTDEPDKDILDIVPFHLLQSSEPFFSYITDSNDSIGINQITALTKLRYFVKNPTLQDTRQSDIRIECLKLWKVPNTPREAPTEETAKETFERIWTKLSKPTSFNNSLLKTDSFKNCSHDDLPFLTDPYSWKWYFASGKRYLIIGLGRNRINAWDMTSNPVFNLKNDLAFELPKGTILEVELVQELRGEGSGQRQINVVYIVDVVSIYNEIFAEIPLKERQLIAEKLCKVVNKPCRKTNLLLKVKPYYRIADMKTHFDDLTLRKCKGRGEVPTIDVTYESFIAIVGVIFCKIVLDPWEIHLSRTGQLYFFNRKTGKSIYQPPKESISPYLSVISTRHKWMWSPSISKDVCNIVTVSDNELLTWTHLKASLNHLFSKR